MANLNIAGRAGANIGNMLAARGEAQGANPLAPMESIARIQNELLQARNTQQIFAARGQAAELASQYTDPMQRAQALQQSGLGAWIPDYERVVTDSAEASTRIASINREMFNDNASRAIKLLGNARSDPAHASELWDADMNFYAQGLPENQREGFLRSFGKLKTSIFANAGDVSTPAGQAKLANNIDSLMFGTFGSADPMAWLTGRPAPVQSAQPMGPFGQPGLGGPGGPAQPGMAPTSGAPISPTATATPAPTAADGKPLWAENLAGKAEPAPTSFKPDGTAIYDPGIQKTIDGLNDRFHGEDYKAFDAAQRVTQQTAAIRAALNELHSSGGYSTPGGGLDTRMAILNRYNVLRGMMNLPELKTGDLANFASLQKNAAQLGFSFLTSQFGASREAVGNVQAAFKSVPGVDNTFLQGQLLNRLTEAYAQRELNKRQYYTEWGAHNHGNLIGADVSFNREHPADAVTNKVLDEFGLGPGGFKTPEDVGRAVDNGFLTAEQATDVLRGQPARKVQ